ncbi:MAG: WYL domain-containing protein [Gemmatimonadota bacterium]|nr:WYL domain-containing protein [Gemmatimonadota bacterium]MDH5759053.1 WYL domain-containing protein [Gemmatimonadota bacterium]
MTERISRIQRWLDIVAFLAAHRFPVTLSELMEAVPSYAGRWTDGDDRARAALRRMFERDKDELRDIGIPIETLSFHSSDDDDQSGYRLARKDFHLPYLRLVAESREEQPRGGRSPAAATFDLTPEEAGAALEGLVHLSRVPGFPLHREARSAFRKLAFDLNPDVLSDTPVVYAEDPEALATTDTMDVLSGALRGRKIVRFHYRAMAADREARRTVRPYGLLFQHGRWYLVGHDDDRDDVRMFRAGRIAHAEAEASRPGTPDYEIPEDFDLAAYAGREAWELKGGDEEEVEAHVLFRFPHCLWAETGRHGAFVKARQDGSQIRAFQVRRRHPFLRWVLSQGGEAVVTDPPELRAAWEGMVGQVRGLYEDGSRA